MNIFLFAEVKEKTSSSINKSEVTADHHQQNGNINIIKNVLSSCPDGNQRCISIDANQTEKIPNIEEGQIKTINIEIDTKGNDMEMCSTDENVNRAADDEDNRENVDEYEHSLWRFPCNRSWLTIVSMDFG